MKKYLFFLLLQLFIFRSLAQETYQNKLNRFVFGAHFFPYHDYDDVYEKYDFYENTLGINASMYVSQRFQCGTNLFFLQTHGSRIEGKHNYLIAGAFTQFDVTKNTSRKRLYIETSLNTGNYYTGGIYDPYRKNGIIYLGYGAGIELNLLKTPLNIEIGYINYSILNKLFDKYNWNQLIFGINYYFDKKV